MYDISLETTAINFDNINAISDKKYDNQFNAPLPNFCIMEDNENYDLDILYKKNSKKRNNK
jgi:hypothetical protein